MKKSIIFSISLLLGVWAFGQVGIGTTSPQGILHIDAAKNTVTTGSTPSNFSDDVIVTPAGNVGIGTLTPGTNLEINNATAGAIKIVDGTQGVGKVLVSDANGVGTWQTLPQFKYMVNGSFVQLQSISNNPNSANTVQYSQGSIILNKGKYMISTGLTIRLTNSSSTVNINPFYLQMYLSSSQNSIANTTFSYLTSNVNNSFGGNMILSQDTRFYNFITGSTIINVLNDNTTIYLVIQNVNKDAYGKDVNWTFETRNYENYLYAVPMN